MTVVTPRVLVVSESRITRRVIEMTFADQAVDLVLSASGQEGVEAWDAAPAAVVLADASMAPPDGLAVARHVQATAGARPAAVLLMAGQSDPVDAAAMADADVRGVIRKPLDSLQLIDAIRDVLRTARAPRPPQSLTPQVAASLGDATPAADAPDPAPDTAMRDASRDEAPMVLCDDDLERVAARVAAIWSGDARHAAAVQALVSARVDDLAEVSAASAAAAVERLAPAAASEAADRLVRELAPALVQQVARLVVTDVSERLVREEIARLRSQHQVR